MEAGFSTTTKVWVICLMLSIDTDLPFRSIKISSRWLSLVSFSNWVCELAQMKPAWSQMSWTSCILQSQVWKYWFEERKIIKGIMNERKYLYLAIREVSFVSHLRSASLARRIPWNRCIDLPVQCRHTGSELKSRTVNLNWRQSSGNSNRMIVRRTYCVKYYQMRQMWGPILKFVCCNNCRGYHGILPAYNNGEMSACSAICWWRWSCRLMLSSITEREREFRNLWYIDCWYPLHSLFSWIHDWDNSKSLYFPHQPGGRRHKNSMWVYLWLDWWHAFSKMKP